jgi:hypothetical protein
MKDCCSKSQQVITQMKEAEMIDDQGASTMHSMVVVRGKPE